jgi:hypothetical protein
LTVKNPLFPEKAKQFPGCFRKYNIWALWDSVAQVDFRANLLGFCFRISQKQDLGLLKSAQVPRVTFSICARGPASLASKEQPLSWNSRFWRESPGPRAFPESVNPFND